MSGQLRNIGRGVAKALPRRDYPVLFGPLKGARFVLGSFAGEGGGASVFLGRSEPEQASYFAREVGAGSVVFDIGANVGFYTVLASRLVGESGKVVAFEPVDTIFEILKSHVELNNCSNVRLEKLACSETSGTKTFFLGPNTAMGSLHAVGGKEITVTTTSIDEFVARENVRPNFLKIDVEGAEMEVLRGGRKTITDAKPGIFLSTHSPELRSECKAFLGDLGYDVTELVDSDDPHEFYFKHPGKCS